MNITVIGGCGAMGKAIVRDLDENPKIDKIVIGDIDREKSASFIKEVMSKKIVFKKVDINNQEQLFRACRGANVIVNAAWYEFNLKVMEAALKVKAHYLDLGGLYHISKKQLKLNTAFKKANLTAIIGMGASPGITNVLAGYGASKLDSVQEIHIRTGAKGGGGFAYSAKTILDEVTMNPIVFENAKIKELPPLSGKEHYTLPLPVGNVEGFYSIHSELATLPFTIKGVQTVTFRVGFSPSLLQKINVLNELGLLDSRQIAIKGIKISPKEFLYNFLSTFISPPSLDEVKALQVEVKGEKDGKTKSLVYETVVESSKKWNLRATAVWTGVPAAITAQFLGEGQIPIKGVIPPEIGINAGAFFNELEKRNIIIKESH